MLLCNVNRPLFFSKNGFWFPIKKTEYIFFNRKIIYMAIFSENLPPSETILWSIFL